MENSELKAKQNKSKSIEKQLTRDNGANSEYRMENSELKAKQNKGNN